MEHGPAKRERTMTEAINGDRAILEDFVASLPQEDRDHIGVMERVNGRVLRTDERDGQVERAFRLLSLDLGTRADDTRPLGAGNRIETRALVVTGKTGAGKSSLITRVISAHPSFPEYGVPWSGCRAVMISTPSPCSPKSLGVEILRVLGYSISAERSLANIFTKVRDRVKFLGKLVLVFDEVHNVLKNANKTEVDEIRTMFKTFMVTTDWPVVLVLSGLPEIVPFFEGLAENDDEGKPKPDSKGEVRRRSQFVHLRSLRLPEDADMVTAALSDVVEGAAGLTLSGDVRHTIVPRLVHASLYELGSTLQLAREAIGEAISAKTPGTSVGLEQFRRAYRARTGCADSVNPFVAPDWIKLDCTLVLKESPEKATAATLYGGRK